MAKCYMFASQRQVGDMLEERQTTGWQYARQCVDASMKVQRCTCGSVAGIRCEQGGAHHMTAGWLCVRPRARRVCMTRQLCGHGRRLCERTLNEHHLDSTWMHTAAVRECWIVDGFWRARDSGRTRRQIIIFLNLSRNVDYIINNVPMGSSSRST